MPTQFADLFAALTVPFVGKEVKERPQSKQGSRTLSYITARTVMNRLDAVLGPENWWDAYRPGQNSVICELTIRLPDGSTITKSDAGGYAGMSDAGDDEKSGMSDAFKRAAVKFGIGRHLYGDGVTNYGQAPSTQPAQGERNPNGHQGGKPRGQHPGPRPPQPQQPPQPQPNGNCPPDGKALYAWVCDQDKKFNLGLLKFLNQWAKGMRYPGRMIDWNYAQVEEAYYKAVYRLEHPESQESPYEEALRN